MFVGKDHVSNANLVSASSGIMKARTIRRCTPVFNVETMIEACESHSEASYYCDTMIRAVQRLSNFFNQFCGGQKTSQTVLLVLLAII